MVRDIKNTKYFHLCKTFEVIIENLVELVARGWNRRRERRCKRWDANHVRLCLLLAWWVKLSRFNDQRGLPSLFWCLPSRCMNRLFYISCVFNTNTHQSGTSVLCPFVLCLFMDGYCCAWELSLVFHPQTSRGA